MNTKYPKQKQTPTIKRMEHDEAKKIINGLPRASRARVQTIKIYLQKPRVSDTSYVTGDKLEPICTHAIFIESVDDQRESAAINNIESIERHSVSAYRSVFISSSMLSIYASLPRDQTIALGKASGFDTLWHNGNGRRSRRCKVSPCEGNVSCGMFTALWTGRVKHRGQCRFCSYYKTTSAPAKTSNQYF